MVSQSSIALPADCIKKINQQIHMELEAYYAYQAIATHLAQPAIALFNVAKRFNEMAKEELEHAQILKEYLLKRGGRVIFSDLKASNVSNDFSLLQAYEMALAMERSVNISLKELDALASQHNETHLATFIQDTFLSEQIDAEAELNGIIAQIKRAGSGLGEYLFDQALAK